MASPLRRHADMVVLRTGGEYLQRRERRLWRSFILATVAGLSCCVVGVWQHAYGLAIAPLAMAAAMRLAPRIERVRKGRRGERVVTEVLRRLPDEYYLINDVTLDGAGGNIDHVVLGPCGAVVIETKRLAGRIRCQGDTWYVNGLRRRSISRQVNRGAVALRAFFERAHPNTHIGYIESITVFTHPLCRLEVRHPRAIVVRCSELLQLLLVLGDRHRMSADTASTLASTLVGHAETGPSASSDRRLRPATYSEYVSGGPRRSS